MYEYHKPVLLKESVDALVSSPDGIYADATFGGGGHSREILSRLSEKGRLIAFDRDEDALKGAFDDPRFKLIHNNFRFIHNYSLLETESGFDGVLADLGVSSHQFDTAERGFSFRYDAPLDMRMNTQAQLTAQDVVNEYPVEELAKIFRIYGEVENAYKLASLIVSKRALSPIGTTGDLDISDLDGQCIFLIVKVRLGLVAENCAGGLKRQIGGIADGVAPERQQPVNVNRRLGILELGFRLIRESIHAEKGAQQTGNEYEANIEFADFTHITLLT